MQRVHLAALLLCAWAAVAGCTPALEWREIRPSAAGLRASFPCRPSKQVRQVPLAGPPVALTLYVCKADAVTFALSHADVDDPSRVAGALQAMRASAEANLGAAALAAGQAAWQVPGMTPQPASGRWSLQGRLPDGKPVRAELAVFSRGTHVVQATLLGASGGDAVAQPFFEGLQFAD
ncbi:MAG TPA: hypothetical protein VLA16_02050 [Ideonella sp.]|nr:hypothetical protein [Ideonella sp.]